MTTPLRAVRVPDTTWHAALAYARDNGTTVSDIVRDALTAVAQQEQPTHSE